MVEEQSEKEKREKGDSEGNRRFAYPQAAVLVETEISEPDWYVLTLVMPSSITVFGSRKRPAIFQGMCTKETECVSRARKKSQRWYVNNPLGSVID